MASKDASLAEIRQQIASGNLAPVYLLSGKESYYTDLLAKAFEDVTPDEDKVFNQYILYAPQIEPGAVMDLCYRCPMMSDRQVVILKEAQAVRADQINKLHSYVEHPSKSTVLVIIFRGDDAKGKDLIAAAKKSAVVFTSPEIRDYQMPQHIQQYIKDKGMTADPKSISMLNEFIGPNLSNMANEIDKLESILGKNGKITPESVERNIGVSKDYNTFELISALACKDMAKVMRIAQHFAASPKKHPVQAIIPNIFTLFSNVLVAQYSKDQSDDALMKACGLRSSYGLRDIRTAMRYYNARQVIEVIWALRQFDGRSKGNGSRRDPFDMFQELMFHILTALGNLGV